MLKPVTLHLLLLFVTLQTSLIAIAQDTSFSINEWVKKLSAKDDIDNKCVEEISRILNAKDSAFAFSGLNELERNGSSSHYFKARFFCIKANDIFVFKHSGGKSAVRQLGEQSLKEAYETDDEYLISYVSWAAGVMTGLYNEVELSATYFLKAEEIIEHLEKKPLFSNSLWFNLGEMLYHAREYEKCVDFVKKGLANWHDTTAAADYYRIRFWNTVGQAYKQLGQLDSAMANYRRSMQLVDKLNKPIWRGINNVNIGELYFLEKDYEKAKQLIQYEYKVKHTDEPNVSAYGLQLLAKINLAENRKDSALLHIKEALELLKNSNDLLVQKMNYLQLAYNTAADVYRAMGNSDSFYRYSQLYA